MIHNCFIVDTLYLPTLVRSQFQSNMASSLSNALLSDFGTYDGSGFDPGEARYTARYLPHS